MFGPYLQIGLMNLLETLIVGSSDGTYGKRHKNKCLGNLESQQLADHIVWAIALDWTDEFA